MSAGTSASYESQLFTSLTTYHGLVRVFNSKNSPARWFWFCVVTCSFALFVVQATKLLLTLRSHPVNTVIMNDPAGGVEFPQITLCPMNPIMHSKVNKTYPELLANNSELLTYVGLSNMQPESLLSAKKNDIVPPDYFTTMLTKYKEFLDKYAQKTGKTFHLVTFLNQTGYACNDLVQECSFGGQKLPGHKCCEGRFPTDVKVEFLSTTRPNVAGSSIVMTDYGRCTTFQLQSTIQKPSNTSDGVYMPLEQMMAGPMFGIEFTLNLQVKENSNLSLIPNTFADYGVKFFLRRSEDELESVFGLEGGTVSAGHKAYVGIGQRKYMLLDKENWGNCTPGWTVQEQMTKTNGPIFHPIINATDVKYLWHNFMSRSIYTSTNCQINCVINIFSKTCGCVPLRYAHGIDRDQQNNDTQICQPNDYVDCLLKMDEDKGIAHFLKLWFAYCNCGMQCSYTEYHAQTAYTNIGDTPFNCGNEQTRCGGITRDYIKANFALISFYMRRDFTEVHYQEQKVTRVSLLAQIGGSMGLFMGMSIITLMEILVFMLKTFWSMLFPSRRLEVMRKKTLTATASPARSVSECSSQHPSPVPSDNEEQDDVRKRST